MYSKRAISVSVALHLALVLLLTVSIDFGPDKVQPLAARKDIVQAVVVDQQAVAEELRRLEAADEKARLEQEQKVREAERKARAAEDKRRAEEKRLKELEAEKQRLSREKEQERKKAEAAKREAEEAERRAEKERRQAEEKRQAEAERKRREQQAREAERKRIEQALQDELAAEEAASAAAAREAADVSEINRYVAAIASKVRQSFTILPGTDGLSCTLRITLIPGGEVSRVEIVKSSGNALFDRQAETAVRKAAPLPVPAEPRLFQKMRSISFVFDPQT